MSASTIQILQAVLQAARRDAFEECAKICESREAPELAKQIRAQAARESGSS